MRVFKVNGDSPGLAMTRSLGDKVGREAGIIHVPEVLQFEIEEDDKFIVIGSDGIWEYLQNDKVQQLNIIMKLIFILITIKTKKGCKNCSSSL